MPSEEKLRKLQDDPGWQKCRDGENQLSTIFEPGARIRPGKAMIVALARKLIIALWRFVTTGEPLEGVVLRPAS